MKNRFLLSLIAILCTLTCAAQKEIGTFRVQTLFSAGESGYYNFRIPSLITTSKGTLIAFCAARKGQGGDYDPIDIAMRRSDDSGLTWQAMQMVVRPPEGTTCDNATPIVDYKTGAIHLIYQIDYRQCLYIRSDDDGVSWSEPKNITSVIDKFKQSYDWLVVAPGPGHGIQMRNGRLVVPVWLSTGGQKEFGTTKAGHRPSIVVSIYSDDHGNSWQAGAIAVPDNDTIVIPNETSCIELADGRVMFNSRNESINYRRVITHSADVAKEWEKPLFSDALFEPICYGSMCRLSIKPMQSQNRILFCNPDSRYDPWTAPRKISPRSALGRRRSNLTIRMSYDEGHSWVVSKVIDPGIAGYSDLCVTPDGIIHCLYEGGAIKGNDKKNKQMNVASFDLQWLTDGKDSFKKSEIPLKPHIK